MMYRFLCIALLACSIVQAAPAQSSDDSKSGQSRAILTFDDNEEEAVHENLDDLPVRGPSDNDNQGFPSFPDNRIETTTKSHGQGFNQGGEDYHHGGYDGYNQDYTHGSNQDYNQGYNQDYNQGNTQGIGGFENIYEQSGNSGNNKEQGGIFGILNKVGEAAKETIHENHEKVKEQVQSVFEAGRGVFEAGKQTFETGVKLGTSFPRFGAKVLDKVANDGKATKPFGDFNMNFF